MKKLLLFSLALTFSLGVMADGKYGVKKGTKSISSKNKIESIVNPTQATPLIVPELNFKGTQAVERAYIGKSSNIYSVLLEEQRDLDYNNETGTYAFTFRADPDTYPSANGNSGAIVTATSQDGETWTDTWLINTADKGRYPSGIVFSPEGNADPAEAIIVGVGPVSTDTWTHNFFASSKINGDDLDLQLIEKDASVSGSQLVRNGLTATTDGFVHVVASKWEDNGSQVATELSMNVWNGEYNGSTFDWEEVDIPVDLAERADGTVKQLWSFGTAWSNDGSIGYIWLKGISDEVENGYQPIVFKSTDQGEDWEEIEIILEDNEALAEYLTPTNKFNGPVWPYVTELDGVVDKNGNLQMFINTTSASTTHPDSSNYVYSNALNYVYNLVIDDDGVQEVVFVDSIMASDVPADSEFGLGGVVGWGARLRASRTTDGSAVFAVWTDSQTPEDFGGVNGAPNIKAAGRMVDGDFNDFPVTNFTADDLYGGFYYFINVGQISKIADNEVHIPITTSLTPLEFGSGEELTTATHSFVKGVKFPWTVGVGIDKLEEVNSFTVGQNTPNPFTGGTTIELVSAVSAPVIVEVSNLMGQLIYTLSPGTINNNMKVELPGNDLKSGVYFYTVTIGNDKISKKMLVK